MKNPYMIVRRVSDFSYAGMFNKKNSYMENSIRELTGTGYFSRGIRRNSFLGRFSYTLSEG